MSNFVVPGMFFSGSLLRFSNTEAEHYVNGLPDHLALA